MLKKKKKAQLSTSSSGALENHHAASLQKPFYTLYMAGEAPAKTCIPGREYKYQSTIWVQPESFNTDHFTLKVTKRGVS